MGFSEPLVVNYAASFSVEVHGAAGLNDGVDRESQREWDKAT